MIVLTFWDYVGRVLSILGLLVLVLVVAAVFFWLLPGFQEIAKGKPFVLSEFESRDRFVQECLASEQYTRDECLLLVRPVKGIR
jgi:hypothetical protein